MCRGPMRFLVGFAVLHGMSLGCGEERNCDAENVLGRWLGPDALLDCGELPRDSDPTARSSAHDCAVSAEADRTPFFVSWEWDDAFHRPRAGYIGRDVDGEWTIYRFESDPSPDGERQLGFTVVYRCASLIDLGACGGYELESMLCLDCASPVIVDDCRGDD